MELPFDRARRRRVYLMRHADAEYIRQDGTRAPDSRVVPLTQKGRDEANEMAGLLADIPFDRAICSGLQRTRETAQIVLEPRKQRLEIEPALEEIRGGDAVARANLSPVDFAYAMFRASEPDACYANGERFSEFAARILPAFNAILTSGDWATLLLVAHGGVNRAILSDISGGGLAAFGNFEQDSGCVNIIDFDTCADSGQIIRKIIRGINITAHDPIKLTRPLTTLEGMTQRYAKAGY
ncbi:MAG: histidine phosphatase family protein [Micropepsaceae bacterium]